ncbi:MAG: LysE family transporter [Nocardioides sp.]|uniref:LysE/ArgO family amino acid transporter n=1 Tax=Nocardioides sp. TaxID=35761 RepID=UPI0039E4A3AC
MITAVAAGLAAGLSLIVAIGAQNAFVLRQGLLGSYVGAVVAICTFSDLVLISAGVGGIGGIVDHAGWVLEVVRWLGVVFLAGYAAASLRRVARAESLSPSDRADRGDRERRGPVLLKAVALTWLNPHVYLDTVLLLGSLANAHGDGRWWFALGAGLGSLCWFVALGYGARLLAPLLARPGAWRALDVVIAAIMIAMALRLALG